MENRLLGAEQEADEIESAQTDANLAQTDKNSTQSLRNSRLSDEGVFDCDRSSHMSGKSLNDPSSIQHQHGNPSFSLDGKVGKKPDRDGEEPFEPIYLNDNSREMPYTYHQSVERSGRLPDVPPRSGGSPDPIRYIKCHSDHLVNSHQMSGNAAKPSWDQYYKTDFAVT